MPALGLLKGGPFDECFARQILRDMQELGPLRGE